MSYVIYNKNTTIILTAPARSVGCYVESYKSAGAAKAALTRLSKKGMLDAGTAKQDYNVVESGFFFREIEKFHEVCNLQTGKPVLERVNTPRSCSVGSELYFSM